MFKYLFFLFIILGLISCGDTQQYTNSNLGSVSSPETSSGSKKDITAKYVPGEVLVKFKKGMAASKIHVLHNALGATKIKEIGYIGVQHIKLPHSVSVEEAVKYYKADPDVEYAEPNYIVKATIIPNDTRFHEQWSLQNTGQMVNGIAGTAGADIDISAGWDLIKGSSSVIVAVIDSGVDSNHPDISINLIAGFDFIDNDNDPNDLNGHGTHVAGIIGAVGNNLMGITGINWYVKIMPLKVLDQNGEGTIADILEAIAFAVKNNARIVNMSFNGPDYSQSLYDTISLHPDILFIAAAGNGGEDSIGDNNDITPEYPASFILPNIISVAAIDQNDNLAVFSNYGPTTVDLAAPGSNILSTIPSFITGITYSGAYKVVYLSFGFEGINDVNSRNTIMQKGLNFNGITQSDKILLVDDDGGDSYENYYKASLQGYTFDVYTVPFGSNGPSLSVLNQYKLVIWFTGRQFSDLTPITLTAIDQANLQAYLDNGGRLFLTGQDIGYEIGSTSFYQNYLHAIYITDDAFGAIYTGFNAFSNLLINISPGAGDGASYSRFVDAIKPLDSMPAFYIDYNDAYQFLDGTSMATPMVSGVAALVASFYSNFTTNQIKETILSSVDIKSSLKGKILTGGRINAYKSITSLMPPSDLKIILSGTKVILTWKDNSTGESGFIIERSVSGGQFVEIASVAFNITTYTDSGLEAGKIYTFRVKAFNTIAHSSNSNESSVTISGGNTSGGGGGGGGGCSIGMIHNYQTALADIIVFLMPLVIILILRRFRK